MNGVAMRFIRLVLASLVICALSGHTAFGNELLDNLISYWKQDDASGISTDAHGTNDLTENGTIGSVAGKINNVRDYENVNSENHSVADNADLSFADEDFSISFWVSFDNTSADRGPLGKYDSAANDRGYHVLLVSSVNRVEFFVGNSDGSSFSSVRANSIGGLSAGTYYHVVCTHSAADDEIAIYVNTVGDTAVHAGGIHDDDQPFRIGLGNATYMDGKVDEVGIWSRVLSTTDIAALYNSGSGLSYDSFTASGGGSKVPIYQYYYHQSHLQNFLKQKDGQFYLALSEGL